MISIVLYTVVLSAGWIYFKRQWFPLFQLSRKLPGPSTVPILGNALIFTYDNKVILDKFQRVISEYGDYCKMWMGPDLNVMITNPDDILLLLSSKKLVQKGPVYSNMKIMLGHLLKGGDKWRLHRKLVLPAYNRRSVEHYMTVFNAESTELAQRLLRRSAGDRSSSNFDMYNEVVIATTQSTCQTLLGLTKEESLILKNLDEAVYQTHRMHELMFMLMTKWWARIWPVRDVANIYYGTRNYVRTLRGLVNDIVMRRRSTISKESPAAARVAFNKQELTAALQPTVDRYIKYGNMTQDEIQRETYTIFTTSQEASAKLAATMLLFLAYLPEWQEKVYDEIQEILGPDDKDVPMDKLKDLQNLELIYLEALRYMTTAAIIQRTVKEDIVIKDGRIFSTSLLKTMVVRVLRQVILEKPPNSPSLEDLKLHYAISVKFAYGWNVCVRPRQKGHQVSDAA